MADLPSYPGTPRWVYVLGIIVIIPIALFILRHFTGAGFSHVR